MVLYKVEDAGVCVRGKRVLEPLTFLLKEGSKTLVLGANGSGKSTLLKLLAGIIKPSEGEIWFRNRTISQWLKDDQRSFRRLVGYLFQQVEAMLFNLTVFDEIAFGPRQLGMEGAEERTLQMARTLGIEELLDESPWRLSGGQQQKVALAAILVTEPQVLLLDEPTSALDPRFTGWLIDFLADWKGTLVVSTHNLSLAGEFGDQALILSEDHRLLFAGLLEEALSDEALLRTANLTHRHRHHHGGLTHSHYHLHDWS
ncbi:MAG: energy-coupling factor ABC transporter ATP-binding protein [Campylobacterales bacterium]